MLEKKLILKTTASVCFGLTMGISLFSTNSFAGVTYQPGYGNQQQFNGFRVESDQDIDELDSLVKRHLVSIGYPSRQMTYGMVKICEWGFLKFGYGLSKQEIDRLIAAYGEEAIGLTFASISVEEADENYFQLVKYMIEHNCVKGLTTTRVLAEVERLLDQDQDLDNIDMVELSFRVFLNSFNNLKSGSADMGSNFLGFVIKREFNDYNNQIGDMRISEAAQQLKQSCLNMIEQ